MSLPTIASLWIGGRLSWLEQLCLVSFAHAGHRTVLYSYEPIPNLPEGVEAADAAELLPAEPMLRHARTGSPAIHADLWRLNLLAKSDAIWVDADMYCHRPFAFDAPHVYGWEKPGLVCNAVLGLPRDSAALSLLLEFFEDPYAIGPWLKPWQQRELQAEKDAGRPVHMTEQSWGFTGPAAVTWALQQTGEIAHARPEAAFYPVSFPDRNLMIKPRRAAEMVFGDDTFGIHFWARRMKPRIEEAEGGAPRKGSFMAGLIERHGIVPEDAPIPPKVKRITDEMRDPAFMARVALAALRHDVSSEKIARDHGVEKRFVKDCAARLEAAAEGVFEADPVTLK